MSVYVHNYTQMHVTYFGFISLLFFGSECKHLSEQKERKFNVKHAVLHIHMYISLSIQDPYHSQHS